MSELSPEARALIDETRHSEGLTPTQRARIRSALVVQMGAGAAVSTGASIGAASTAAKVAGGASFTLVMATKAVATIAIVGGVGAGSLSVALHGWPHREPARSSATARPPKAAWSTQTARPPEAHLAVPHEEPLVSPRELPSPVAPPLEMRIGPSHPVAATSQVSPAVLSASASSLENETRLLRDASFELGAGRPERALALLDEHASSFSGGALVEEGRVERILALCALGRAAAAHDEGARFLRERPHALLADRVRASCGGHTADGSDEP